MLNSRARLVLTWGALTTGVAAILLPFTWGTSPVDATFTSDYWWLAVPFYLALPIGLASMRWPGPVSRTPRFRAAGWLVAAAGAGLTAYFCLVGILGGEITQPVEWLSAGVPLGVLAAGAVVVLRKRAEKGSGVDRSIAAMQVAYVANASLCLVGFAGQWQSGAWCALATVLMYVVQIASEMNGTDAAARESRARAGASALARLFVMVLTAASITASGCGGSPTQPSQEDRIAIYSGQWRAVIGDVHVVLQIHAVRGGFAPGLDGTGTAVSRTTGETNQLKGYGVGTMSDDSASGSVLNIALADEVTANGIRLGAPGLPGFRPGS